MCSVKVFVGLDYHQELVQVCVLDETGRVLTNRSLLNNAEAILNAVERFGAVQAAAIEACCGAANLAQELVERGWSVSLAHAGFVARMKQNPDKTDYSDARLLADLLRVGYLPKVWFAPNGFGGSDGWSAIACNWSINGGTSNSGCGRCSGRIV